MLVSDHFDGIPWLERVYQAGDRCGTPTRWAPAPSVHCYTPAEFERKVEQLPLVRAAIEHGLELLPEPAGS